jgi:ribonuclease VapC
MVETQIVLLSRIGPVAVTTFRELIEATPIVIVPFDETLATAAFEAYQRYGKGRGHPAQLNIVDCAAYPLARLRGLPLLFKGNDFTRTDAISALALPSGISSQPRRFHESRSRRSVAEPASREHA